LAFVVIKQSELGGIMKLRVAVFGLIVLIFFMSSASSYAENVWTVKELHQECLSKNQAIRNSCVAFITGVMEAMVIYGQEVVLAPEFRDRYAICPEGMISSQEGYKIFVAWAEKNPETSGQHQGNGVISAIRERWPCDW
jgi:hypothetical protein